MDTDKQDSNADVPQQHGPQEEEGKNGPGQTGNLPDRAEDQISDAQLNQGQGNQGQQGKDDSQIEGIQDEEESGLDIFSDEASNEPLQHDKRVGGRQSEQTP